MPVSPPEAVAGWQEPSDCTRYTCGKALLQVVAITSAVSCASHYAPQLRSLGFRVTAQRMAILHVLRHSRGHLSPLQVFARACRSSPGLTRPTVYRTLQFLTEHGLAWQTSLADGHLTYELADSHHDHLSCRRCGTQVQVDPALVDGVYRRLEYISGYALDHHHLSLSGLCPKCRRGTSAAGRKPRDGHST